jgi:hypothetical protein
MDLLVTGVGRLVASVNAVRASSKTADVGPLNCKGAVETAMVTNCPTFSFQNISFAVRFGCLLAGGVCELAAQPPDRDQSQDIEQHRNLVDEVISEVDA